MAAVLIWWTASNNRRAAGTRLRPTSLVPPSMVSWIRVHLDHQRVELTVSVGTTEPLSISGHKPIRAGDVDSDRHSRAERDHGDLEPTHHYLRSREPSEPSVPPDPTGRNA